MKFIVTEKATRPAQLHKTHCFYCQQPIGAEHKDDCVLVKKKYKVKFTIEYDVEVPADWDAEMVEYHRNEGSWCVDNVIQELDNLSEQGNHCLCGSGAHFEAISPSSEAYLDE